MREVAVVGVGMTKFGRTTKSLLELFSEAAIEAINESNIKPKDIQAMFVGNALGDFAGQNNLGAFCPADIGAFNIPSTRFDGACASSTAAARYAAMCVAAGYYDIVLAGGTEKTAAWETSLATRFFASAHDSRYEYPAGITFPGIFALMAHLYAKKYNIPIETLKEYMAAVSIKSHDNGFLNPKAQFRKRITREDVFNSIMVAQPLQLYDCCPFSDGGSAVVITSLDIAKRLTNKPVLIVGHGQGSAGPLAEQKDITIPKARMVSAKQAYSMAGITPEEIDVCELHDCFTIAELVTSECLGFFEFGKSGEAVMRGETRLNGRIPIGPSGGLKAKGHPVGATGTAQIYEIVKQMRGECGARQIEKDIRYGITDTLGGDLGTISNIILKKGW